MSKRAVQVKLTPKLVEEVEDFRRQIRKYSGCEVTREQAAHALLRRGLRAVREHTVVDPFQMLAAAARDGEKKK